MLHGKIVKQKFSFQKSLPPKFSHLFQTVIKQLLIGQIKDKKTEKPDISSFTGFIFSKIKKKRIEKCILGNIFLRAKNIFFEIHNDAKEIWIVPESKREILLNSFFPEP
jgi:hypothetical protein